MNSFPKRLGSLRILLTNDDGIGAPGLKILRRIAARITDDIWICAPEAEQSGAGHSLSLMAPLRLRHISGRRYSVDGTPTDCVLMAIHRIMADHPPDLVLSGVNRGGNLGEDITYSGTIAAAMEATLLGVPAIALSQDLTNGRRHASWAATETHGADIVRRLCRAGWPKGTLINVNFPDLRAGEVAGVAVTRQGQRQIGDNLVERIDPRGRPYYWIGAALNLAQPRKGTDMAAVENKMISVTPIHLDFTHTPTLRHLREALT